MSILYNGHQGMALLVAESSSIVSKSMRKEPYFSLDTVNIDPVNIVETTAGFKSSSVLYNIHFVNQEHIWSDIDNKAGYA